MEKVILCGNANVGKSTYFNMLSRGKARVGNWLGVTSSVMEKEGELDGKQVIFADLPGLNSLKTHTQDEAAALKYIEENKDGKFLKVCDINNLRRNLFLALELINLGLRMQIVFNFRKKFRGQFDIVLFEKLIGLSCIFIGEKLKEFGRSKLNIPASDEEKHKLIEEIMEKCYRAASSRPFGFSRLDKFLLNRWAALPIFIVITVIIFSITFILFPFVFGGLLDHALTYLQKISSTDFYQSIVYGTLKTVLVFLPQIAGMLFCIYVLENSGYISRLAFLTGDFFNKIGLSGKSVFPMLLSFGCASVAVDFVKTIKNENSQIKTAASLSLLPCSAKLPITLAIFGYFLGGAQAFLAVSATFFACIILALLFSAILNRKAFKTTDEEELVLEFPPLRMVKLSTVTKNAAAGTMGFLYRIFSVVLLIQTILFLLKSLNIDLGVLSPVFAPLGFDENIAMIALIFGVVAKELVLTTAFTGSASLAGVLSPASLMSFLIFSLLYVPCASTIAGINDHFGPKVTSQIMWRQFVFAYICAAVVFFIFGGRNFLFLAIFVIVGIISLLLNEKVCRKCKKCVKIKQ